MTHRVVRGGQGPAAGGSGAATPRGRKTGAMAADPRYVPKLMALGIGTVSVGARHIPTVRRAAVEAMAGRNPK